MQPTSIIYAELQQAYDHFNQVLFGGKLPECLITLQRERRTFGYFSSKRFVSREGVQTDEIAMNPSYFGVRPVRTTLSTLAHEMAHLWQDHFGNPSRSGYHNKEWAEKMRQIGLMPSNTGKPGGRDVGQQMTHYIIEGGAYDRACASLLTTEFTLSWLDRFPPVAHSPILVNMVRGEGGNEDGDDSDDDGGREGQGGGVVDLSLLVLPVPGENRSNRVKYRCPSCAAQVWGKPNLAIICGETTCAETAFMAV